MSSPPASPHDQYCRAHRQLRGSESPDVGLPKALGTSDGRKGEDLRGAENSRTRSARSATVPNFVGGHHDPAGTLFWPVLRASYRVDAPGLSTGSA
ncbi:hypothetical protein C5E45_12725 [Nocardia nova]|uniref:Uncharacterized protein n=1 Tax=Nocardia nova TaxID=37330 RepID=A0A2S6AS87_9NOCA|nr:hypothetical protein C5E41_11725 [Nocardia nova]PPJ38059.1 hypothetical protein C5E45_12725 [Nocardia nova]